jgi:steroid delta-isomerase-like uncharacterized protein
MTGQQGTQQNITLVKSLYDEVYTKGSYNTLSRFFSDDIKLCDAGCSDSKPGIETIKNKEMEYKAAFPNKNLTIDDIWAWEDKVVVCWTATGTHKGDYKGVAPTNNNAEVTGISIYHCKNGKITLIQQKWDRLSLLEQIDVVDRSLIPHAHH